MNVFQKLNIVSIVSLEQSFSDDHINELFWIVRGANTLNPIHKNIFNKPIKNPNFNINKLDDILECNKGKDYKKLLNSFDYSLDVKNGLFKDKEKSYKQYEYNISMYHNLLNFENGDLKDFNKKTVFEIKDLIIKEDLQNNIANVNFDKNGYDLKMKIININGYNYYLFSNGIYSLETGVLWIFNGCFIESHPLERLSRLEQDIFLVFGETISLDSSFYKKIANKQKLLSKIAPDNIIRLLNDQNCFLKSIILEDHTDEDIIDLIEMKYET